jgi:hypothetical protein
MNKEAIYENVHFRLIKTPCCGQLLCWVNPRFPNFCPECGTRIYPDVKQAVIQSDTEAWLHLQVANRASQEEG